MGCLELVVPGLTDLVRVHPLLDCANIIGDFDVEAELHGVKQETGEEWRRSDLQRNSPTWTRKITIFCPPYPTNGAGHSLKDAPPWFRLHVDMTLSVQIQHKASPPSSWSAQRESDEDKPFPKRP